MSGNFHFFCKKCFAGHILGWKKSRLISTIKFCFCLFFGAFPKGTCVEPGALLSLRAALFTFITLLSHKTFSVIFKCFSLSVWVCSSISTLLSLFWNVWYLHTSRWINIFCEKNIYKQLQNLSSVNLSHHENKNFDKPRVSERVKRILRSRLSNEYELYNFISERLFLQSRECHQI